MVNLKLPAKHLFNLSRYSFCRTISNETNNRNVAFKREWNITLGRTDDDAAYTVKLNNINLKTPLKNLLRIQDETLALAVVNEWKSEAGNKINKKLNLSTMHLTAMAYEAIDNPFNESKDNVANSIIEYLKFDTVRFRDVDNEEFLEKQSRHWDPLIGWFEHNFECHLPIEYGNITSIGSLPKSTHETLMLNLQSHERWPLIGMRFITKNLKSFVLTSSLTKRFLKVEQAVDLARLETKFQTERWSKVEWEHDIDEHNMNARVAAGTLFYHLSL